MLKKRVPELTATRLERFVLRGRKAAGLKGTVDVLATGSEEMKRLNREYRGKSKATDVLSFPAGQPHRSGGAFAGDLAISVDIAARNAHLLGHSVADEVKILVLHGILHLAGYDHERDNGRMARREEQLRRQLRLPIGLIERVTVKGSKQKTSRSAGPQGKK